MILINLPLLLKTNTRNCLFLIEIIIIAYKKDIERCQHYPIIFMFPSLHLAPSPNKIWNEIEKRKSKIDTNWFRFFVIYSRFYFIRKCILEKILNLRYKNHWKNFDYLFLIIFFIRAEKSWEFIPYLCYYLPALLVLIQMIICLSFFIS